MAKKVLSVCSDKPGHVEKSVCEIIQGYRGIMIVRVISFPLLANITFLQNYCIGWLMVNATNSQTLNISEICYNGVTSLFQKYTSVIPFRLKSFLNLVIREFSMLIKASD